MFLTARLRSRASHRWTRAPIIPSYFLAFLLGVAFPVWQPFAFFAVSLIAMIVVTTIYRAALWRFAEYNGRPSAKFIVCSVSVQMGVLATVVFLLSRPA